MHSLGFLRTLGWFSDSPETLPSICSVNASNTGCSFIFTAGAATILKSAVIAGDVVVSAVVVTVVGAFFYVSSCPSQPRHFPFLSSCQHCPVWSDGSAD